MIISASRRTDIPAFYSTWFMNRVRAGLVAVPNPMNAKQVSWVSLRPGDVDAIVFWTRNPLPLLPALGKLDDLGFNYYFQYTITGYPKELEPHVPTLQQAIETFSELSRRLGRERVIWRYDPIMFFDGIDEDYHWNRFRELASTLAPFTEQCVISFLDVYRKAISNLSRALGREELSAWPINMPVNRFAEKIGAIAKKNGIRLTTCAESVNLERFGIWPGRCIDSELISRLFGIQTTSAKDPSQREQCGCVASKDIGMYDSCLHGCVYCYANISSPVALKNRRLRHDPRSASLLGWIDDAGRTESSQLGLL
jgi:DNA repair photolyase